MKIYNASDQQSKKGNPDWFTGDVWQDIIMEAPEPARVRVLRVTFAPGARTAWHTHPLGQTLHIIQGTGLIGVHGSGVKIIKPGDSVWVPPNEKHWHGATEKSAMIHIAVQESLNGKAADWLEKVSDLDYVSR